MNKVIYLYRMTNDRTIHKTILSGETYKIAKDTGYVPPCIGKGSIPIEDSCDAYVVLKDGPNDSLLNFENFLQFQKAEILRSLANKGGS